MVKVLLALAIAAMPASDGISAFAGGQVKSPDGKWTVWAPATDPDGKGDKAIARLKGPGVRDRGLMPFERSLDVIWPRVAGQVVVIERTERFASIHVFTLGPVEAGADRIQADIERAMARYLPRLGNVEARRVAFGAGAGCVLVEDSGLPAGREEGSFLSRRAAFRLDLARKRALPVRSCPAARIEG